MQVTNELQLKHIPTPATPPAGYTDVYIKSDGKLYGKDASGVETLLAPIPNTGGIANTAFVVTQTTHTTNQALTGSYVVLSGMTQTLAAGSYFLMFTGWADIDSDSTAKVAMFNAGTEIGGTDGETMRQISGLGIGIGVDTNIDGNVSIGYYVQLASSATIDIRGKFTVGTGTFKKGVFVAINLGIINIGDLVGSSVAGNRPLFADSAGTLQEFTGGVFDKPNGAFGIGVTPTAYLDLKAGTTSLASLRIRSGVLLTTPLDGAIEYNGTNAYFTIGSTRYDILLSGAASTTLDSLSDVTITTPASGQTLKYNGSQWVNSTFSLDDLSDVIITTPATDQVLKYNGTNWVNGTAGVTGSGTAGTLSKWTSSTVLGNSIITESSGRIGINSTTYSALVTIKSAGAGDGMTFLAPNGTETMYLQSDNNGGQLVLNNSGGTNTIYFAGLTGTTNYFNNGGALAINNTSATTAWLAIKTSAGQATGWSVRNSSDVVCGLLQVDTTGAQFALHNSAGTITILQQSVTNANSYFNSGGNLGLNTTTFDSTARGVFVIGIGTPPAAELANSIQIFARDSSAGTANSILAIRTEQAVETLGLSVADSKMRIWLNGTEYYLLLDTV